MQLDKVADAILGAGDFKLYSIEQNRDMSLLYLPGDRLAISFRSQVRNACAFHHVLISRLTGAGNAKHMLHIASRISKDVNLLHLGSK